MSFFRKLKTDIGAEEKPKTVKTVQKKVRPETAARDAEGKNTEQIMDTPAAKTEKQKGGAVKETTKKASQDWLKSEGQLAVDVYEANGDFCIQAPIAGVSPLDIDISIEDEMLVIKGERKEPDVAAEKEFFYQECYWGPFSRQIILPEDADPNRIKASLQKGILSIRIPRVIRLKKKKVTIAVQE